MKLLRLFIIFLLALAIPLEGVAAISGVCMEDQSAMKSDVSRQAAMDAGHDGCDMSADAGSKSPSKSPAPCKMGSACKICQASPTTAFFALIKPISVAVTDVISMQASSFLPSHDPSGLWRPPRFI